MRRSNSTLLALLSVVVLAPALAGAVTMVVPNGYETTAGNDANSFPFNNFEGRYQQAYGSDQFDSGLLSISEIAFRTDEGPAASDWLSELSFEIYLSTSQNPVGSLSTTFADNLGADQALVLTASAEMFGGSNAGGPGPNPFDLVLTLDTPFLYDTANGDLLMEVLLGTNTNLLPLNGFSYLDEVESTTGLFDVGLQRVWNSGGDTAATAGSTDIHGSGLVTRFTYEVVPEPGSGSLLALGLLSLAARRRRA